MLPVRLWLRNFISYGDGGEELDFRNFHLACVSGNNGEGKSALLDAITWALWGVARGTDVRGAGADDLIHLGTDEAEVVFDFQVDHDLWRVERHRKRGRYGGGLNLLRKAEVGWENAGGATATLTQQRLNNLLGLDYQTFINSAFLLQGRADEFSRQGASDRKKILADILGLGVFERLSDRARARARSSQTQAGVLELEIERMQLELARQAELRQQEAELAQRVAVASQQANSAREELAGGQKLLSRLEEKSRRAEELAQVSGRLARQVAELSAERAQSQTRLAGFEELLAREEAIEQWHAKLLAAREAEAQWTKRAGRFAELAHQRELRSLEISREKAELAARAGWLREQAAALTGQNQAQELTEEIATYQAELGQLEARQQQAGELREKVRLAREGMARLAERNRQLQSQLEEHTANQKLLQRAEALCPVCRQRLSEERCGELFETIAHEQKLIHAELDAARHKIARANEAATTFESRLRLIERETPRLAELRQRLGEAEARLAQTKTAHEQRARLQAELSEIEGRLTTDQFATDARGGLAEVEVALVALSYDAAAHRQVSQQVAQLRPLEEQWSQLNQARSAAAAYREALTRSEAALQAAQSELATVQGSLTRAQAEVSTLPQVRAQFAQLRESAERAAAEVIDVEKQLAVAKSELARLAELRRTLAGRQKEREVALEQYVVHGELTAAYGKNGLQALIIETALPQLEKHTNELLERLSENRMRVFFQTQRERGGELAETLDIRIRDQNGERRYELYSGGEAFRLNFAIRLALSRFLAQRAGAKLSTLVIDEGFGSQDFFGRQRLLEAIRAVAADFDRILVITHLDELKAEFPHRIEVYKDESGSHIRQVG